MWELLRPLPPRMSVEEVDSFRQREDTCVPCEYDRDGRDGDK
jgi:hypothetical protein